MGWITKRDEKNIQGTDAEIMARAQMENIILKKRGYFSTIKISLVKSVISLTCNMADLFYTAGNLGHIYSNHNSKLVTFLAKRVKIT